jgi:hypothetical protein
MKSKIYDAPWGRRVWVITLGVWLMGLALSVSAPWWVAGPEAAVVVWVIPGVFLAILGLTALFCVRRYELTDDALLVRRSFWTNRVPLEGLESVEQDERAFCGAWKTMGNDGLYAVHRGRGRRSRGTRRSS